MVWDNGNKGPWGSGPSGGGSNNGSGQPPHNDIDDLIRKSQDKFKSAMSGGGNGGEKKIIISALFILAFVVLIASTVYRVNTDQLGVVLRFGEYHRTTTPGLNFKLPYPFEEVLKPSVTSVNRVEVGTRAVAGSRRTSSGTMGFEKESLMLTGDRNIVDIDFEVQWKIDATAPQDFLFNVRDPAGAIKPIAESAMREVVGKNELENILTTAQSQIADDTKRIMQGMLDEYGSGVEITAVNLSRPDVPAPVIDEFQDVKRAEQDKETAESVAEGYRNEILPKAKGQAVQMEQEALAYKDRVINEAEGDAARFISVYNEYRLAKDVTKKRIYLETMEEVLGGMNKIILDGKSGNGVLPYLPLQQLQNKGGN